ncbi:MAG: hypothetical protein JNL11_05940 [Bdellovibrionaceae bacterium]|nr:hypothetical protein [Pseudobdellovibrionaceae bacterium]
MIRENSFLSLPLKLIAAMVLSAQLLVAAEKLDLSTHDSLIQKLESILSIQNSDTMFKQSQIALRLADLYAERARLLSLEDQGKGDILFKDKIAADRAKAIKIYSQILPSLKSAEKGRVLLQSAHLHILMKQEDEAIKIYSSMIKNAKAYKKEVIAAAQIQWADILFYKGEFEKSSKLFRDSLKIKENSRKGYALYRDAWCLYNMGKTKPAQAQLLSLLKNKDLFLKKDQTKNTIVDVSFQEEVSRDLATFMARNGIVEADIHTLMQLSPDSAKQKNLIYLATELDRTAKKESALMVWMIIGQQKVDFISQLEGQIQITRIQYDLGRKGKLLTEIDRSIVLLKNPACKNNDECLISQQNLKKILTEWGKAEERAPSTELILGFSKYTQSFDDAEMSYWTGHSSLKLKMFSESFASFKKSAQLLAVMDRSTDAKLARMFEGSLLGAIEAAEQSKDTTLELASYRLYLELNPRGAKRDEIKYQIAHLFYEADDFKNAADLFREIALDPKAPAALRDKSAELCLDSSVILKEEAQIETDSLLFAQTFKSRGAYFLAIWRKSILNQSAQIINSKITPKGQLEQQWQKLDKIAYASWPVSQMKTLIKNKLAIGMRLKNLDMVAKAAGQFLALDDSSVRGLSVGGLSMEEKNWALDQAAWVAEMRMDFKAALNLLKQVTPKKSQIAEHHFKVALLMELAHQDPSDEYLKFMKISKDAQKNQYAAYQLIHYSAAPKKLFSKYGQVLKVNPQLYAAAGVITYEKSSDMAIAKTVLAHRTSKNTFESQILARSIELKSFEALQKKLAATPFAGRSDRLIQKNLVERIRLIKQLERKSQAAIQKKDSSLQLILLAHVYYENSRLVQDVLALPVPKQLSAEQKKMYQEQIQLQMKPYITQAIVVKEKISEMWETAIKQAVFKDLFDLAEEGNKPGSRLAHLEVEKLKKAAEISGQRESPFINFTRERHKVATEADQLQKSIVEDPFNFNDIEKFKALQKELGRGPMVAYLNSRIEEINSRGGR